MPNEIITYNRSPSVITWRAIRRVGDIEYYDLPEGMSVSTQREIIENNRYGPEKRKSAKIKIIDPEDGFSYGNCATCAISRAFSVKDDLVKELFKLIGADCDKGCTWRQCHKCINSLCRIKGKLCRYYTNKTHISSTTFYKAHKKGLYFLNFHNHLSVLKNGTVYDSYIGERGFKLMKLMGWWELTK